MTSQALPYQGTPESPSDRAGDTSNGHPVVIESTQNAAGGWEVVSDLDEMYLGPHELLDHFEAGAVVTHQDALEDDSRWVIRRLHPEKLRRLKWMLGIPADAFCAAGAGK
jgi:hypothetical protein